MIEAFNAEFVNASHFLMVRCPDPELATIDADIKKLYLHNRNACYQSAQFFRRGDDVSLTKFKIEYRRAVQALAAIKVKADSAKRRMQTP